MKTLNTEKRPAGDRGTADHGWLNARFTFSFAEYFDPDHMGFGPLRVINNDTVAPGGGFPPHPHESMEIFTYVVEGRIAHKDSMGNEAVIEAGDLQYMSAGNGVRHSEFNPSNSDQTVMYQIWIQPKGAGGTPRYAEKKLTEIARKNDLTLLFSPDGRDGSTSIRQDAEIHFGRLEAGQSLSVPASDWAKDSWIQVIEGNIEVLGDNLVTGDGLAIENQEDAYRLEASADTKFLLFRLT